MCTQRLLFFFFLIQPSQGTKTQSAKLYLLCEFCAKCVQETCFSKCASLHLLPGVKVLFTEELNSDQKPWKGGALTHNFLDCTDFCSQEAASLLQSLMILFSSISKSNSDYVEYNQAASKTDLPLCRARPCATV